MNVILSIKPKYVKKIIAGEKRFEYRKSVFKQHVERIYIYASSPICRIVGEFSVADIFEGSPENIWLETRQHSGINKQEYDKYFQNHERAYAIKIQTIISYTIPINPYEIDIHFRPPQSFGYYPYIIKKPKLIFIGGVHGVGKSVCCNNITAKKQIPSYSCGELIQWNQVQKKVKDVASNQRTLSRAINNLYSPFDNVLIDGHFVLWNLHGGIETVGLDFFKSIKPSKLIVIEANPEIIKKRLETRDGLDYCISDIELFQKEEVLQARFVSQQLEIPLFRTNAPDCEDIISFIQR